MIDRNTVQQILDAADIVEVVSDFVSLRRRGANYVGLCPFHNEKTPSFSVNKARGICKCFSCGKGGGPVNFIMEHEKLSYYEALKYLAAKYNIEVKEKELTQEERNAMSRRETMLAINDFAMKHFQKNLTDTDEGRDVGLSYFRERGITDESIEKFSLGYSMDSRDDLFNYLHNTGGFDTDAIFETGLCSKSNFGDTGFDRFKGRVMFPVFNVAGKIVAFGGRTLKNEPAKYVNSPESSIYNKRNELYGLFQAKRAIVEKDKCFLVEGYTDVISMHQSGICNVVASSGTSLTDGQIRLIHRFTNNVTVLYDGDSAGIKASLRGIDLLLAEGLNIKVLLLPEGEDPDSFARSHSASELNEYIAQHETDFISFKTAILLDGAERDPIKKSAVISDIVRSIAIIPDRITQSVYARECSVALEIDEKLLVSEINKVVLKNKEKDFEERQKQKREEEKQQYPIAEDKSSDNQRDEKPAIVAPSKILGRINKLVLYEQEIVRLLVRYAMMEYSGEAPLSEKLDSNYTVAEYLFEEIEADGLQFSSPVYDKVATAIKGMLDEFQTALSEKIASLNELYIAERNAGIDKIRNEAITNIAEIEIAESNLENELRIRQKERMKAFRNDYVASRFVSHQDADLSSIAVDMLSEKHKLSKIYKKDGALVEECDRIGELVPRALNNWKNAIITSRISEIYEQLKDNNIPQNEVEQLIIELQQLNSLKIQFASVLGERVVLPKSK